MKHAFYDFFNLDLKPFVETPLMKDCINILVNECMQPPMPNYVYNYTQETMLDFVNTDVFALSLAEMSPFEDIDAAMKFYETNRDREVLCHRLYDAFECLRLTDEVENLDHGDIRWFSFQHYCEPLAVFFIYPLVKMMFPDQTFQIYRSSHTFVINRPIDQYREYFKDHIKGYNLDTSRDFTRPLVFEINYLCRHLDVDREITDDNYVVVSEGEIIDWYFAIVTERSRVSPPTLEYVDEIKKWYKRMLYSLNNKMTYIV